MCTQPSLLTVPCLLFSLLEGSDTDIKKSNSRNSSPVHINKKRADSTTSISAISDNEKSIGLTSESKSIAPSAPSQKDEPPSPEDLSIIKQKDLQKDLPLDGVVTPAVFAPQALAAEDQLVRQQNPPMMNNNGHNGLHQNFMPNSPSSRMAQAEMYAALRKREGQEAMGSNTNPSSAASTHNGNSNGALVNAGGRNAVLHNQQVGQYHAMNQAANPANMISRERLSRAQNLQQMNSFRNDPNNMSSPPLTTANMREQLLRAQMKDEQNLRREQIYLEEILRLREREQMLSVGLMPSSNLPPSMGPNNNHFGGFNHNPPSSHSHQLTAAGGGHGHNTDLQMEQDRLLLQVQKYRAMNASFHQRNPGIMGAVGPVASLNDGLSMQDNMNPAALMRRGGSLPGQCISGNNFNSSPAAHHMPSMNSGRGRDDINDNLIHYSKRNIIPLGTEDDQIWLSEFLCFLRAECVEVFCASKADVRYRKNSKKIKNDQVGIRCRFCAHLPHQARGSRSSSYPSSISRIYQSFTMMIRDHFSKCNDMPPDIRMKYNRLKASTTKGEMESKRYWTESASTLGLYDEPGGGILFRDEMSSPK